MTCIGKKGELTCPTPTTESGALYVREQLMMPFYQATPQVVAGLVPERLGTFQDNLRAPIHRWFKYPAGFSYFCAGVGRFCTLRGSHPNGRVSGQKKIGKRHWKAGRLLVGCRNVHKSGWPGI